MTYSTLIPELIWVIFLIGFGFALGWSVQEWRQEKANERTHSDHMGLYGDPLLVHWFRLRSFETSPKWRKMPLREYRKAKMELMAYGTDKTTG